MDPLLAWLFLIFGIVLPAIHVLLTKAAGGWAAPADGRCPFGPRTGWLIVVTMLPFAGWMMFVSAMRKRQRGIIS